MAIDVKLNAKADQFSQCMRDIKAKLGKATTLELVVKHEVARTLEKAADITGHADTGKIMKRVFNKTTFTINGRRISTMRNGKVNRRANDIIPQIEAARAKLLARKLAAVNLTRRSWYDLAILAGLQVKVAGNIVKAKASAPHAISENGEVSRVRSNNRFGMRVTNSMPVLRWTNPSGSVALFKAINSRLRFFNRNMKKGVFSDIHEVTQKYRGIQTSTALERALVYE